MSQTTPNMITAKVVVVNTVFKKSQKNVAFMTHLCYYKPEVIEMLGDTIKALRKENGMTQTELSQQLNRDFGLKTDRVMVSKWETGFQTPVFSTLSCIAELFGVSIDTLNSGKTQEKDNVQAAKVALFSGADKVTDEMWQEVVNFAKYVEAREAQKNENK